MTRPSSASDSVARRLSRSALPFVSRVGRSFLANRGPVRAASLSYTSLLALIPLLALVLSVSKGILRSQDPEMLTRAIDRFLSYAVPQLQYLSSDQAASARQDAFARIQEAISRIDAGALGVFGAITLVSVGVSLLSAIEGALNDVWGVRHGRTLARRVVYYWAGVTLGPMVPFVAIGLTGSSAAASVLGRLPGGFLVQSFWFLLPFLVLTAGLSFVYRTLPNTTVPTGAAIAGGVAAGLLLQLNNMASAVYFSQVVTYSAVYGSLGAVPVLMVGLYLSWMIVLVGAEVAYAVATPLSASAPLPDSQEARARIALEVARTATVSFLAGRGGSTATEIASQLGISPDWVLYVLRRAADAGLFAPAALDGDESHARYLPARPPDQILALDVVDAVTSPAGESGSAPAPTPAVAEFLSRRRAAERSGLGGVTLETLAREPAREAT